MTDRPALHRRARRLEYATIVWNLSESAITVGLGIAAGSLALIGFGADSLVEVFASVVVLWHLAPGHAADHPGRTARALHLVGAAFVFLAVMLTAAAVRDLVTGRQPEESLWGIGYLALAALAMFALGWLKRRVAIRLDSAPMRSEANMSFLDGILALATLLGLALNAGFGWWWADPAAALVVAVAALNEARENWEEADEILEEAGEH